MTIDRGTAEGQWQTWLQRLPWDGWIDEPGALQIWGYASRPSYRPGDTVELCVSTTADSWGFEVWRDGEHFEKVFETSGIAGVEYAVPADPVAHGCGWPVGASFTIPSDWVSGGYIVVLRGSAVGCRCVRARSSFCEPWTQGHDRSSRGGRNL